MDNLVIIYGLLDPETGELRYVGKTKVSVERRLTNHLCDKSRNHRTSWIANLKRRGMIPECVIIEECSEDIWEEAEMFYISYFSSLGCNLTNSTKGGDGGLGRIPSLETRKKMVESHALRDKTAMSDEMKAEYSERAKSTIGKYWRGRKQTLEHVEKRKNSTKITYQGKLYLVSTPEGELVKIQNLTRFCKENSLSVDNMRSVLKGKRKHHKGYSVEAYNGTT